MARPVRPLLDLGHLPFHVGANAIPSNGGLPDSLPFALGVREDVGLLVQVPNPEVAGFLSEAYSKDFRFGTAMSGQSIGRAYAEDFLAFIIDQIRFDPLNPLRGLEIGCGTGYLLHRVRQLGAEMVGLEPAAYGQEGAARYGVPIRQETFPGSLATGPSGFDLIVHYAVLEHIQDPVSWLRLQGEYLSDGGAIAFAVPDDRTYVLQGDLSTFCHEHWSYFSPASLARVVERAGLRLTALRNSGYGASLYAVARKQGTVFQAREDYDLAFRFERSVARFTAAIRYYLETRMRQRKSIGLYCPARAINVLHHLGIMEGFRFFDDDTAVQGKYLPPCRVPIESRGALRAYPVDEMLIMSLTFGDRLATELRSDPGLEGTTVQTIREVLAEAARPD